MHGMCGQPLFDCCPSRQEKLYQQWRSGLDDLRTMDSKIVELKTVADRDYQLDEKAAMMAEERPLPPSSAHISRLLAQRSPPARLAQSRRGVGGAVRWAVGCRICLGVRRTKAGRVGWMAGWAAWVLRRCRAPGGRECQATHKRSVCRSPSLQGSPRASGRQSARLCATRTVQIHHGPAAPIGHNGFALPQLGPHRRPLIRRSPSASSLPGGFAPRRAELALAMLAQRMWKLCL